MSTSMNSELFPQQFIPKKTAVMIGRFQSPIFHEGYQQIVRSYPNHAQRLVILVGSSEIFDQRLPIPYHVVAQTIRRSIKNMENFPKWAKDEIQVSSIADSRPNNELWLDDVLSHFKISDYKNLVFLTGRDGFQNYIDTNLLTSRGCEIKVLPTISEVSGTMIRSVDTSIFELSDHELKIYAEGYVAASKRLFPTSYSTVDILPIIADNTFLLGRKCSDPLGKYRLVGGFVDPQDHDLEAAALRELQEETCINKESVLSTQYIGSYRINDYRYRNSIHKIMTNLFVCDVTNNATWRANDDICELKAFSLEDLSLDIICEEHKNLIFEAIKFISN